MYERNRKYAVKFLDGNVAREVVGYIDVKMPGAVVVNIYNTIYRLITAHDDYRVVKPVIKHPGHYDLIITVINPQLITPCGPPIELDKIPYALRRTGTWWKGVIAEHVVLPEVDA